MAVIEIPLVRRCDWCGRDEFHVDNLFENKRHDCHVCTDCVKAMAQYIVDIIEKEDECS